MKPWLLPAVAGASLAMTVAAASLVGPMAAPSPGQAEVSGRGSVLCPDSGSASAPLAVAVAATVPSLRTSALASPGRFKDRGASAVLEQVEVPMRVSSVLGAPFAATATLSAEAGPEIGWSALACRAPAASHWFAGIALDSDTQTEVVLANLDPVATTVDLAAFGASGRIPAPRGIQVEGNSAIRVSLGSLPRSSDPAAVVVSSSNGRVVAYVRQRNWSGTTPVGSDWLPPAIEPATDLVVPGIPSGTGARTLVVANPGSRTAVVSIRVLSESGSVELVGAEKIEVAAGVTGRLDLSALEGQPAALQLTSTQPVTAGVILSGGGSAGRDDPAYTAAAPVLPANGIWPIATGKTAANLLQLANPGSDDATVLVTRSGKKPQTQEVQVPAGSIASVSLPKESVTVLQVQTAATGLRAAIISTRQVAGRSGLAVVGLVAGSQGQDPPAVELNPHAAD